VATKKTTSTNTSASATSMEELLKKADAKFTRLQKGENVSGVITKLTPQEILVDLGGKAEAIVLEKDRKILRSLLSTIKVGDKVTVSVLNPESDFGYPVVSLRRFLSEGVWKKLEELQKENKKIRATITESTRGGFMVEIEDGISGFLPNSHASFVQNAQDLIGSTVDVVVLELNRSTHKIIFSQKAATTNEDFNKIAKKLKIDQKIKTTINNVASFGLFTVINVTDSEVIDGFIHSSEVSWDQAPNLEQTYQSGVVIDAVVIGFDTEAKRANLSIKKLSEDPFIDKTSNLKIDQKISGTVKSVSDNNILVNLGNDLEGFIPKDKVPAGVSYEVSQPITVTISEIDKKKRRITVSPLLLRKTIGYR